MKYNTRCNISNAESQVCGANIATTSGIAVPEVGAPRQNVTAKYVQAIIGHLQKHHPERAVFALNTMEQYLAFITLGLIQTDDPGVMQFMAQFSEFLCTLSALPVTNDMLEAVVSKAMVFNERAMEELSAKLGLTEDDPFRSALIESAKAQRAEVIKLLRYVLNLQARKIGHGPAPIPANSPEESPVSA